MKSKCIIVDDEPLAIDLLKNHLEQFEQVVVNAVFQKPLEAFEYLKTNQIDLLFIDIQMPTLTGLDFIRSLSDPPKVILTTAYREYALDGFELNVVDYLLKPITFERFLKAMDKYFEELKPKGQITPLGTEVETGLYVRSEKKNVRIEFENILFIESAKDYINVNLTDKQVVSKEKLSQFEKLLPDYFLRVHRSFIVNTHKITAFTNNDVEIDEFEIPIGGFYKQIVFSKLS